MMRNRLPLIMELFAKFGVLSHREIRIGAGMDLSRSQANRYLQTLTAGGYIRRRHHPSKWIFAYEATEKLFQAVSPDSGITLQALKENELAHRLACSHALLNLCRRSFVSGVAIEHELTAKDLAKFCIERIPDGIIQVTQVGHPPFEMALEVETTEKSIERIEKIMKNYEKTVLGGRHYCQGLLIIATPERSFDVYRRQLEKASPVFRGRVILSSQLDLSDVSESTFGQTFPSAQGNDHFPCATKRSAAHEGVKYLNHINPRPPLKGTESRRRSADGLTVATSGTSKPIG